MMAYGGFDEKRGGKREKGVESPARRHQIQPSYEEQGG